MCEYVYVHMYVCMYFLCAYVCMRTHVFTQLHTYKVHVSIFTYITAAVGARGV